MKKVILFTVFSLLFIFSIVAQDNVKRGVSKNSELTEDRFEGQFKRALYSDENLRNKYEPEPSEVDYEGFRKLSDEVYEYRKNRLVGLPEFLEMSKEEGTIILDTRSKRLYDDAHMKGAVHLNFSDFTDEKLAEIIPSKDTRILIYCNNNFEGGPYFFQPKRGSLALNVPTFINLYGYDYKNVYELKDLIPYHDGLVELEGEEIVRR